MPSCHASTRGRNLVLISGAALCGTVAYAQSAPSPSSETTDRVTLSPLVVSATRSPQDPRVVPNAVTAIPVADLRAAEITTLGDALASAPGVSLSRSGAVGGQASVFLRGAASHQTLFVVDGIRMNDRTTLYQNLLGGAGVGGYDRIEVLRGPQSTLYGSTAVGGIILLNTTHGCGDPTGRIQATGGSNGTWAGGAEASGGTRTLGYSGHVERLVTDNQRDWNHYSNWGASTRVEYTPTSNTLIGFTARAQEGTYQEPGTSVWPSRATVDDDNHLATAYAQVSSGEAFTSRLTLGQHNRHYRYSESWGSSDLRNRRRILDWQNTFSPTNWIEVIAGTNWETSRYWVNGSRTSDRVSAGYLSATAKPVKHVIVTGGVRYDDYGTFGSATTGRGGVTWFASESTKVRTTYGTGFIAPGVDDRYGVLAWGQRPNPNLRPEKASGWDAGVDQDLPAIRSTASITYFDTHVRDLFEWQYVDFVTFEGQIVNRASADLRGIETAIASRPFASLSTRVSYTHTEARDSNTNARLSRRPRHVFDGQVTWEPTKTWAVGSGLRLLAGRFDTGKDLTSLTVLRFFGHFQITSQLRLSARVENALDRTYEEVLGYPALRRQIFGSLEWSF